MSTLLRLLALCLALLAAIACGQPTGLPTTALPKPAAGPANPPCGAAAKEDAGAADENDDDGTGPGRHPPDGLPQLLPTPAPASRLPVEPMRVELVADGLSMPLSPVWTPDGRRLFFSEIKLGRIRVMVDGALQTQPFATLPVAGGAETGLLGLAVDPGYTSNHYVYAYHSDPEQKRNRVIRFEDRAGLASAPTEIFKSVSVNDVGGQHNGGRLAFGPDGKLYISAGNSQNRKVGQDACKLGGKILRINRDGSRPDDNPYPASSAYAIGFRNPFGIAFHPSTNALFATDNGGKGHDELDLVRAEGNYGHPIVEGMPGDPRFVDPLWESGPISIGPTGLAFYTGDRLPEFKNDLFFCAVHTGQLSRVRLAAPAYDRVESMNVGILKDQQVDCRLDVANGPDGALYFTNFSKILRITR